MIDINAPIIPYEEMGGVKLYSTIRELKEILSCNSVKATILHNFWIRYDIEDYCHLFFHLLNGKLFRITTLKGYKGLLWNKISVGMKAEEFIKIEPSFKYDDFEEVYECEKGIFIETDVEEDAALWISVYIKELNEDDFDEANW